MGSRSQNASQTSWGAMAALIDFSRNHSSFLTRAPMDILTETPGQKLHHLEPREVECLGYSHIAKDRGRICTQVF